MELAAVISVIGALVTVGSLFLQWRKFRPEIKVLDSQSSNNLAQAAETAAGALIEALKFAQDERNAFETRIDVLEAATKSLTASKEEGELRIRSLGYDINQLQAQVKMWQDKYAELETKYLNSKKAIGILVQAWRDDGKELPPGLELLLGDSISKFKLPKAGQ